jgi:glycosyltransferase involved in cell wall biosynthesis
MCAVDFTVKQFLTPLVDALQEQGHAVTIACSAGPYIEELRRKGYRFMMNPVARSMNVASHANSVRRTYLHLRREKFDVVHVHTPIAGLIGRVAAAAARVPIKIYTAHGFYFHDEMHPYKKRAYVEMERLGARMGDFIMTVSREDEEAALKLGIAAAGEIETIYNGVDTNRFDPGRYHQENRPALRRQWKIPEDAFVVGVVGRLVREKGFIELFEAAAKLSQTIPNLRVLVVGDTLPSDYDAGKSLFHARIQELGISDRVLFTGMVDDTAPALAAMDVFCLASYREGMPVSLLEAMAMELPAVATNIRGCREEVQDGETGILIPTRNSQALAEAVRKIHQNNDLARRFGRNARQRVLKQFDIRTVLAHQLEIYDRLIAKHLK